VVTERIVGMRLPRGERREQILAAAAEAFAETGFRGTSLADVAARVGVSQPGLLHHYPNKEALILAVLQKRDEEDQRYLAEVFGDSDAGVVEWYTTLCLRNAGRPELVRLYTVTAAESLDPTHPAHGFFQGRYQRIRTVVAERIATDQERGRLPRSLDPTDTATELIALMDGLQLQWLMQPSIDMCAIFQRHLARLAALSEAPQR
jgi:AcrR family transcriptional regulator